MTYLGEFLKAGFFFVGVLTMAYLIAYWAARGWHAGSKAADSQ